MEIDFKKRNHCYIVDGDIAGISVTELLRKHKLAPDYEYVDKKILQARANKGKAIHADLEKVLNVAGYEPLSECGELYRDWVRENLDCGVAEQMLAYNYNGLIIAGTADVMAIDKEGNYMVLDHKVTTKLAKEYVSWQVSLLDYMARQLKGEAVNGRQLNWQGAKRFMCLQYTGGKIKEHILEKVPDEEIVKLIECEYNDKIYQRPNLVVGKQTQELFFKAEQALRLATVELKKAQEEADKLRQKICNLFEKQKIYSWETDTMRVSYVPQTETMRIDSTLLKRKYPTVYQECCTISKRKAHVRTTQKQSDDDKQEILLEEI